MTDTSYPIGKFEKQDAYTQEEIQQNIAFIDILPDTLSAAIAGLDEDQMNTPYREGGWTVNQVIHHLADSHMNAFIRTKLMVTEDNPTILPYRQAEWAELPDSVETDPEISLSLLTMLHHRWVMLLRSLKQEDMSRTYVHPEYDQTYTLAQVIALYAWHSKHHTAHITTLRYLKGW